MKILTIAALAWVDTVLTMDQLDPNYIRTNWKGPGVTGTLTTTDGGKTWKVPTISIPAYTFTTA